MANKKEEAAPAATPDVVYEVEEIPIFYANVAQMTTSPYDVAVTFGRRAARRSDDGPVMIADAIQVYMSPQHARSLAELLERQLAIYVDRYGSLPSDTPRIEEAADEDEPDS